jgi:ABC-type branched-subunit amino acid transport system substrate-binding protein
MHFCLNKMDCCKASSGLSEPQEGEGMNVSITAAAHTYLSERGHEVIRIAAKDTYECSTMVEYFIQEGIVEAGDQTVDVEGLTVIYNEKAEAEMGNEVKVDYVPSQGLKLVAPTGVLAYAQRVRLSSLPADDGDSRCGR